MYRKIEEYLKNYFSSKEEKILVIDGARQVGKTYIIEKIGKEYYRNFISINLDADKKGDRVFEDVKTCDDFYIQLSALYGNKLNNRDDTLVFIDEISIYPQFFSLLKQLRIDNKYRYICSGSLLGIELLKTGLTPMGSIIRKEMYHYKGVHHDCYNLTETLWDIMNAIDEKKEITITYLKQTREEVERRIQPVAVIFSEYYFYLVVRGRKKVKLLDNYKVVLGCIDELGDDIKNNNTDNKEDESSNDDKSD